MSEELDKMLAHHGVLGMHWGKRKAETSAGAARRATYKTNLSDAKDAKKNKVKLTSAQADALETSRFKKAAVVGSATAVAIIGASWIAKQRYDNGASDRNFRDFVNSGKKGDLFSSSLFDKIADKSIYDLLKPDKKKPSDPYDPFKK